MRSCWFQGCRRVYLCAVLQGCRAVLKIRRRLVHLGPAACGAFPRSKTPPSTASLGHFRQNSLSNLRTETSCVIDAGEVGTYRSSPVSPKRAAEPHFPHVSGISTQSLSGLQKNGRRGLEWMVRSPGRIFNAEAERILNKVQYFKIRNIGYPRMYPALPPNKKHSSRAC